MHSASRCTSWALLVFVLALAAMGVAPRVAQASPTGTTCSMANGAYSCGTDQIPDGVTCFPSNGVYQCYDAGGSKGIDCDYTKGQLSCSGNTGGGAGPSGSGGSGGNATNGSGAQTGGGWLDKLTGWQGNALHATVQSIFAMLKDIVVFVFKCLCDLFAAIAEAITPPDFISHYSIGGILSNAGPIVGFFVGQFRVGEALGLIGAAYGFRLLRKFLTLFQW